MRYVPFGNINRGNNGLKFNLITAHFGLFHVPDKLIPDGMISESASREVADGSKVVILLSYSGGNGLEVVL